VLPYRKAKEIFERQYFENLLKLNEDNITRSALSAGISRRHLQEKIRQLNL
jgi:DNA-binding NtrC family response regulator